MGWNGIRNVSKEMGMLIGLFNKWVKPGVFGKIVHISLHSFSDISGLGYRESSYLRLVDEYKHRQCTMMMAKARVTHRRFVSISRLELVAGCSSKNIYFDQ